MSNSLCSRQGRFAWEAWEDEAISLRTVLVPVHSAAPFRRQAVAALQFNMAVFLTQIFLMTALTTVQAEEGQEPSATTKRHDCWEDGEGVAPQRLENLYFVTVCDANALRGQRATQILILHWTSVVGKVMGNGVFA